MRRKVDFVSDQNGYRNKWWKLSVLINVYVMMNSDMVLEFILYISKKSHIELQAESIFNEYYYFRLVTHKEK
jgi:hypothetical protein